MSDQRRKLMWWGMLLFLIGLLTGLAETQFANVRMGLAAHLEGVVNGIFLIALSAGWSEIILPPSLKLAAFWIVLAGAYGNWLVTSLAAAFGTAALSPINGARFAGPAWQEVIVTVGFGGVAVAMIGFSVLALWGLRRRAVST